MFLLNGEFLQTSAICHLSVVKTKKGDRRWNATMTKEIIDPDTYYIDIKLMHHSVTLAYEDKNLAQREYHEIVKQLVH